MSNVFSSTRPRGIGSPPSPLPIIAAILFGLALFGTSAAAWVTHVIVCIKASAWILLAFGCIVAPVGVIHGIGVWFGVFS